MQEGEVPIWGIHAGRTGDAHTLFLSQNVVALGWHDAGNLSALAQSREAFKAHIGQAYPDAKAGSIINSASQLYRFIHEMREGDLIAYPSKTDRMIHLGRVSGPYQHTPQQHAHYPNTRAVTWLRAIPRTSFSQGALYEIGSALSLFQIKTYADEFRTASTGHVAAPSADTDETVAAVAQEIEESTSDFILKRLAQELKGHPFAHFIAHLLSTMGYRSRVSPEGADGGVDIIAHKDELGFEPPIVKVQVKSTDGSVGHPVVTALYGTVTHNEYALVVTLGVFTPQARAFERSKSNLRLIDGSQLVALILEHYDQFDSRYRGLIPLRRVYVPESLVEQG